MATDKPRITISLDQQTLDIYRRFAELSGQPTATIISHMLVEAREHFVKLGVLLQKANSLVGESHDSRSAFVARIDMGLHRAKAAADLIGSDLVEMAQKPAAVAGAAQPRSSAAGVPNSLIHRNISPKPVPTRVPAGLSTKKKTTKRGAKSASLR